MKQDILDKLNQLEKTSIEFKNIAREEGILLNTIIKTANFKNVLEAGTSNGYSGIWLSEAVQRTGGHVKTIERDSKIAQIAENNFKEVGLSDLITILHGDVYEVMRRLNEQFDLIFFDGGSDYVEMFKLVDSKLLKPNGILAVDNVILPKDMHKPFIDTIEKNDNYQKITLNLGKGLLIALKLK